MRFTLILALAATALRFRVLYLRELHDTRTIGREVSLAYDHVTGGRISKPTTHALWVIAAHDDWVTERINEAVAEVREEHE